MSSCRKNFIAVDLGAGNGRVIIGRLEEYNLVLKEAHRFRHSISKRNGVKRWNWNLIQDEIRKGLIKACEITGNEKIESVSCDSWAQDFGLLDEKGNLFYEPVSYRDSRTKGLPRKFSDVILPLEILRRNGSVIAPITTLCQLYSMDRNEPGILHKADTLLFIADLVNYSLCGKRQTDRTFASASQMSSIKNGKWDVELLAKLGIPGKILPPILESPGIIGNVIVSDIHPKITGVPVVAGAGHDTALASSAICPMKKGTLFMSLGTWAMLGCCYGKKLDTSRIDDAGISALGLAWGKWALFHGGMGMWLIQECMKKWVNNGVNISYSDLSEGAVKSRISLTIDVNDERFFSPEDMTAEIYSACLETKQELPEKPEDFAKIIFDSLTLGFKKSVDKLKKTTGMVFDKINIVSGGSRNKYLCSRTARILGIPVIAGPAEAAVVGNIILQARVMNVLKNEQAAGQVIKKSFPGITYKA